MITSEYGYTISAPILGTSCVISAPCLAVPRVAPTWRSCLTTQLEQQRRRKSVSERGCGNGLRSRKIRTLQAGAYVADGGA